MTMQIDPGALLIPKFNLTNKHLELICKISKFKDKRFNLLKGGRRVQQALNWVRDQSAKRESFFEEDICSIHKHLSMDGQYRTREFDSIAVGEDRPYLPPDPEYLPLIMNKFVTRYSYNVNREFLEWICEIYLLFVLIHPFKDGNGRTGRLLCCWKMFRHGYGFIAPCFELRWGNNENHRRVFESPMQTYTAWLAHPDDFSHYCSNFYLYFLEEIVVMLDQLECDS